MKKLIFTLALSAIVSIVAFAQSGESGFKKIEISSKKSNPPVVVVTAHFFDSNGNQALDANEEAKLSINLKNSGGSIASGLKLIVSPDKYLAGFNIGEFSPEVGDLTQNSEKNIDIVLKGGSDLQTGNINLSLIVQEKDGFSPQPYSVNVVTRELAAPMLVISDFRFTTQEGGKIVLGRTADLNIVVQNNGDGNAENLIVKFANPENVFPGGNSEFSFSKLGPGEKQLIKYTFLPNEKFTGTEIPIEVIVKEKTGRFGANRSCKVSIEEELIGSSQLIAENENDLIYRGGGDPLKGLNTSAAKQEMRIGDYYALIIGIDNYKGAWTPLDNAKRDAMAIEQVLKSKYKFDHFQSLYNEQATRKQILKELEWLVANVKETDNVFIYYSGHGEYKSELDKGYWVPVDALTTSVADFISNNDIQTFLSGIKSKHTLLIADACFSGDIFRGKTVTVPFENSEKYYSKVHNISSRKAISSGGIEPVMDGGQDGHSVFAYYLIKSLQNNSSKYYDASQLYENIKIPVINNSDQTPKFNPIKNTGDEGGQFIFIQK